MNEFIEANKHSWATIAKEHIEWFHEFDWLYYRLSAEKQIEDETENWIFPEHKGKLPFTFSLKATIR
jgi:hypothetical protein